MNVQRGEYTGMYPQIYFEVFGAFLQLPQMHIGMKGMSALPRPTTAHTSYANAVTRLCTGLADNGICLLPQLLETASFGRF